MLVHRDFRNLPAIPNPVLTIGTFDGVHLGHQKIISSMVDEALAVKGQSLLITFEPHPRKVIRPDEALGLINTLDEKISLLAKTKLDHLVVVPFDKYFSEIEAEDYIEQFLVKFFKPHTIIIGYDHHFGKMRRGNFELLSRYADEHRYRLLEIPKYILNEIGISSTRIRTAILDSDISSANNLLGYNYFFHGTVESGDRIGRTIGYPTANLAITNADKIHLGHGVFAVYVEMETGEQAKGMLSIGTRPTLTDPTEKVEVNIFEWDREIYGEVLKVSVKTFLRYQEKYPSLEELTAQLHRDKEDSLAVL